MEPNQNMDQMLKAYAARRREEAGEPVELHPATRSMLQGEVARVFSKAGAPEPRQRSGLFVWLPRLALTGALGTIVVTVGWFAFNTGHFKYFESAESQSRTETVAPAADVAPLKQKAIANEELNRNSRPPALPSAPAAPVPLIAEKKSVEDRSSREGQVRRTKDSGSHGTEGHAATQRDADDAAKEYAAGSFDSRTQTPVPPTVASLDAPPAAKPSSTGADAGAVTEQEKQQETPKKPEGTASTAGPVPASSPVTELGEGASRNRLSTGETNLSQLEDAKNRSAKTADKLTASAPESTVTGQAGAGAGGETTTTAPQDAKSGSVAGRAADPSLEAGQATLHRQFTRVRHAGWVQEGRNAPSDSILSSFTIVQQGNQVRIVDADGSIYTGQFIVAPAAKPASHRPEETQTYRDRDEEQQMLLSKEEEKSETKGMIAVADEGIEGERERLDAAPHRFRVTGTNRTHNLPVEFEGDLVGVAIVFRSETATPVAKESAPSRGTAMRSAAKAEQATGSTPATPEKPRETAPGPVLRIQGDLRVGGSEAVKIQAF